MINCTKTYIGILYAWWTRRRRPLCAERAFVKEEIILLHNSRTLFYAFSSPSRTWYTAADDNIHVERWKDVCHIKIPITIWNINVWRAWKLSLIFSFVTLCLLIKQFLLPSDNLPCHINLKLVYQRLTTILFPIQKLCIIKHFFIFL